MKPSVLLSTCLSVFVTLAKSASIPSYFERSPSTPRQLSVVKVQRELGARLSKNSVIFGPDDPRYTDALSRWNNFARPKVQLVIEPAQESDVSTIVKYCNRNSVDFLANNKGHGATLTLASFDGIQIYLAKLRNIDIQPSGKSAWFGGGVYDGQVSRYLWDKGYVATTGACDCVGMMGPGLGGGHGRQEGLYGMISDNIRQLNVVLADGSAIRVNKDCYSDLLWGMKGAGHNFGIVTSFELNIYPRGPDTWHYHNYLWTGDKLEAVFNALNKFHNNGSTPINMANNYGFFAMNPNVTDKEPVMQWMFAYRGTAAEAEKLLADFNEIPAVGGFQGDVPYPQISSFQGTAEDSPLCQHGGYRVTDTAGLQVYNITAERQIFDSFKKRIAANPVLAAGANILHEGYSTAAVRARNSDDSAYPLRHDNLLMLAQIIVPPGNKELEKAALKWTTEIVDQWNAGQPSRKPTTYVNYANGGKSLESIYGYESWRLKRLRGLKAKYDPFNRFRFYNPIVGRGSMYLATQHRLLRELSLADSAMRLLERDDTGGVRLTEDLPNNKIPPYAILSYTWGPEEVLFRDMTDGTGKNKASYAKIRFCGDQAWRNRLKFFWVDTYYIDKSNSAELQHALNCMFHWYRSAVKCYVYLADVSTYQHGDGPGWQSAFRQSRWFSRGWTLQELIAPTIVEFFSKEGERLGDKESSLEQEIHDITGIPRKAFQGVPLSNFSVAERMRWIEKRDTKYEEDKVYSLFGIFDVHIPVLYGEGR
ncbi:hypothetical protein QBC32DRAFT_408795 [Pseudoneurospora amorphoporcata]|uniref:FAD-binding PCMH-type domain-containing protein n=1 Tax=Pseudoneurospora amorphoporcata TaxID=241081 RepID=A0AAN6SBI4_9PEZI|nr:hypothetical protein QBC32DRAFT_408795 [Pseudoneurospora amorphoporcata]